MIVPGEAWLEFRGRVLDAELGMGWMDGVHPDDVAAVVARRVDAIARRAPYRNEFRMRRADGQYRRVRVWKEWRGAAEAIVR